MKEEILREKKLKKPRLGLIGLGLFFLIVPGVNVYDLFPDFIAYFLFARALSYSADRAPYFAEAKDAFLKLGIVTLIKIPASFAMTFIRSNNAQDADIRSLFSLTFAVIEFILIVKAVRNLFLGFSYLGERTSNCAFIQDFPINKKGTRKMSPDGIRNLTYVFAFYRCLMYFVPELLLLTRGVSAEEYYTTFNVARLYPYTVIFSLVTVLALGIFWKSRLKKHLLLIKQGGGISECSEMLMTEERRIELKESKRVGQMKMGLTALFIASILSVELRLENFYNIDLLPSFVFGFVFMFAISRIASFVGMRNIALGCGGAYTAISFVVYLLDFNFFKDWGYEKISIFPEAKAEYGTLVIVRGIETLLFSALMALLCFILIKFIRLHTGIEPSSPHYSRQDSDYHKKLTTYAYISCTFGILSQIARFTDCIFKYFNRNILVDVENSIGTVTQGLIPWFGTVVIIFEALYIASTLYISSTYKEEVYLKYTY